MIKFEIKFRAANLIDKPDFTLPVISSKLFYMTPDEFTKLQTLIAGRDDMRIEVLQYHPSSAEGAVAEVERLIGQPVKGVHAYA